MTLRAVASTSGSLTNSNFSDNEIPTGTIDSSNTVFTLAHTPSPAASLDFFINGLLYRSGGLDYTLSGATVTTTVGATPQTGDNIRASYRY